MPRREDRQITLDEFLADEREAQYLALVDAQVSGVHLDLQAAGLLPQSEAVEDGELPWAEWPENLAA